MVYERPPARRAFLFPADAAISSATVPGGGK